MRSKSFLTGLSLALLTIAPSRAQEVVQALPGTTDADALAAEMRRLAANPRDVGALVDAAQLSLKLGDMRAAAALLARADSVDPRSGRVKAGQGSILVQSERPGEALRYFAQAESLGLDARTFAADRALAYDLTGEQERAQRDYRIALRDRADDPETIRRYALSLGISGQRAPALALLDPLVRRSDRGAWRSQAFVLAMTGDVEAASRIAATMMPGGAAGLSAFFQRLPALPAIDRAFAVHFGQVRATPERLADARMAPTLPSLAREPGAATLVASNMPVPNRRNRRERDAPPTRTAAVQPLDSGVPYRTAPPVTVASVAPRLIAQQPPAPRTGQPNTTATAILPASTLASVASSPALAPAGAAPTRTASDIAAQRSADARPAAGTTIVSQASTAPGTTLAASAIATPLPAIVEPAPARATTTDIPTTPAQPAAVRTAAVAPSTSAPVTIVSPRVVSTPPRSLPAAGGSRMSEDSILARIVAGLSIPASELDVKPPPRPVPATAAAASAAAPGTVPNPAIAAKAEADRLVLAKLAAAKSLADKRIADRKAAADRKALVEKKAAAEKKAIADQEAAEARKLARSNPPRIWVQVAGGAYEGDLPKAWSAVKAKAPTVFGGRQAWTTPLRATNRVLAGPFKTDAEARGFVNDLKKQGVSAFTFTSDAGQPVKRLAGN